MEYKELEFAEEWLGLEKYHFKILAITTILADEKRAFRGKLSELCKELGIQASSANITKIKNSLSILAENDYIKLIIDNGVYTISLAQSVAKSKNIIKIKKAWYKLIRENHLQASWESTLKVFLILLEQPSSKSVTYEEIGTLVNLKKSTVKNCVAALRKIDFKDFIFNVELERVHLANGEYRSIGQTYQQMLIFE